MKKVILILLICTSCVSRKINYNHDKILKNYKGYTVFLEDEKVDLNCFFIDKTNIKEVLINKKTKELKIQQKEQRKLFFLNDLKISEKLSKDDYLIVVDGAFVSNSKNFRIDSKVIKSVSFLSDSAQKKIIYCSNKVKQPLLIVTQHP